MTPWKCGVHILVYIKFILIHILFSAVYILRCRFSPIIRPPPARLAVNGVLQPNDCFFFSSWSRSSRSGKWRGRRGRKPRANSSRCVAIPSVPHALSSDGVGWCLMLVLSMILLVVLMVLLILVMAVLLLLPPTNSNKNCYPSSFILYFS